MKPLLAFVPLLLSALNVTAQTGFSVLEREHTDLRVVYTPGATNELTLVARDADRGVNLASNEVILVARESSRLVLPPGTPFGDGGAPLWVLPQSQNVNLLYLGVSAEGIPTDVFSGPVSIELTRFDGPGYFMAWQATGPGQFNIRINTRDGVTAADGFQPLVGAHEHFNWGFSTTGVYAVTFQAVGRRVGETTNLTSAESTFVFHVQPLPPPTNFAMWAKSHWPPGFDPPTTLTNGNPDGDAFDNLHEYAFGLSPTNANPITDAPQFWFAEAGAQHYGALTFNRYLPALDLLYEPQVSGALPGGWLALTSAHASEAGATNTIERVTLRDSVPARDTAQRFYRLRSTLLPP